MSTKPNGKSNGKRNGKGNGNGQDDISIVYLKHIAPIVEHLSKTCKKHNICMLSAFSVPLTDEGGVIMLNVQPDKNGQIPAPFAEAYRMLEAARAPQQAG